MPEATSVLVVDDEPLIAKVASLRLRNAGYDTSTASDGRQGVSQALQQKPDVILMDVRMPRMDGLTALAQLRSSPETSHIPVVMLSASLMDKQAALDAGARFFLTKPYDAGTLIAAVDEALLSGCAVP